MTPRPVPAPSPPGTAPNRGPRVVAGLLWLMAAGLAGGATFAPFYRFTQTLPDEKVFEYAVSGWSWNLRASEELQADLGPPTLYGIPLIVCGAVLLLAAVVALAASSAKPIGMLATGLIVGTVSMEFVDALGNNSRARSDINTGIELGTWLLVGSAGLAIIGALLTLIQTTPRPQPMTRPARAEPDTPRFGVPAPPPDSQ